MCDNNNGKFVALLCNLVNRRLHFNFTLRVESRRGFVKDQNFWFLDECSRNCDALLLATGHVHDA